MQEAPFYHDFDLVSIYMIHRNVFFDLVTKPDVFAKQLKVNPSYVYKPRPAIIVRTFSAKGKDRSKDRFLVVPLTSKESIDFWDGATDALRILYHDERLAFPDSYLMLDELHCLLPNQIEGFYLPNENKISFNPGQKLYIKANINEKLGNIIPLTRSERKKIRNFKKEKTKSIKNPEE